MNNVIAKARSGVKWTTVSMVLSSSFQFLQTVIMANLLSPEDFGVMAVAFVVIGFVQLLAETGFQESIIQRKHVQQEHLYSLFWLNLAISVFAALVISISAPLMSFAFDMQKLEEIIPVVGLTFIVSSFSFQYYALAQRNLHFNSIAFAEVLSVIGGFASAVFAAWYLSLGVWSLVIGYMVKITIKTLIFVVYGVRRYGLPRVHFKRADIEGYLSFGMYRIGAAVVNFFNSKIDQLLIGFFMGASVLGIYSLAVNLVLQPIQRINPILTRVAFPLFSKFQDDVDVLRKAYFRLTRLLMFITAPILIGALAIAPLGISLFLGEKWASMVEIFQVLCIYAVIRSLMNAGGVLIVASGKASWTLVWNLIILVAVSPVVLFVCLTGELLDVALALLCLQVTFFFLYYHFFIKRIIGNTFSKYLDAFLRPFVVSIMMAAIVYYFSGFFQEQGMFELVMQIIIGVSSYFILSLVINRSVITENLVLLR